LHNNNNLKIVGNILWELNATMHDFGERKIVMIPSWSRLSWRRRRQHRLHLAVEPFSLLDINEFVYSIGSSSLTTPRASQGVSSSHVAEEDIPLSVFLFNSNLLSLPTSFSLIQPLASGLGGGASISSSASQIVKRARKRREDERRKRENHTHNTHTHARARAREREREREKKSVTSSHEVFLFRRENKKRKIQHRLSRKGKDEIAVSHGDGNRGRAIGRRPGGEKSDECTGLYIWDRSTILLLAKIIVDYKKWVSKNRFLSKVH